MIDDKNSTQWRLIVYLHGCSRSDGDHISVFLELHKNSVAYTPDTYQLFLKNRHETEKPFLVGHVNQFEPGEDRG